MQWPGDVGLRAPGAEAAGDLAQCADHLLGDPVAEHQRGGLLVVALRVRAEVLDEGRQQIQGRHLGTRPLATMSTRPRWSMCWWVMITSSRPRSVAERFSCVRAV